MAGDGRSVLTVLGSGTCVPDAHHHSACLHVDLGSASVLLDCGPGTLHGLDAFGVPWAGLTHLAFTHFHTDHVGDLAAVLFALKNAVLPPRTAALTMIGPEGFRSFVQRLADALGDHVLHPGFDVRIVELSTGEVFHDPDDAFVLRGHAARHSKPALSYRLEGDGRAIGYTGDTGPSGTLGTFLAGCAVLVSECAIPDPPGQDDHLSPVGLADLARVAEPDLLVVSHVYPPRAPEDAAADVRRLWDGEVVAARDGLRVVLDPDVRVVDPLPTGL